MGVRQIRLNTFDQIQKRLKEFTSKKMNIVLVNRTVLSGELISVDDTRLTFKNMRLETYSISLSEINEVYLDIKA